MKTLNAKTLFASLAAVAAVTAVATPAAAQSYRDGDRYERNRDNDRYERGRWDGAYDINRRQERLERYIADGIRSGGLTRREVVRLRGESHDIARLEARYRVNGLTRWERADLDRRFDRLESLIQAERMDGQKARDYGSGYGHRR